MVFAEVVGKLGKKFQKGLGFDYSPRKRTLTEEFMEDIQALYIAVRPFEIGFGLAVLMFLAEVLYFKSQIISGKRRTKKLFKKRNLISLEKHKHKFEKTGTFPYLL